MTGLLLYSNITLCWYRSSAKLVDFRYVIDNQQWCELWTVRRHRHRHRSRVHVTERNALHSQSPFWSMKIKIGAHNWVLSHKKNCLKVQVISVVAMNVMRPFISQFASVHPSVCMSDQQKLVIRMDSHSKPAADERFMCLVMQLLWWTAPLQISIP